MNIIGKIIIGVLLLLGVAAAGYWFGTLRTEGGGQVAETQAAREILYYRNPMGLPDTSPVPKKDSMGMDYIPVYEHEPQGIGSLNISAEKIQKIGVKSEAASMRVLDKTIRAAGRIEIDERRTYIIAPKFEGWVEKLYVNTTGEQVGRGQRLFDVYSPELISAQHEYELATKGEASLSEADQDARSSMKQLAEASRMRLKNWDIGDAQIVKSADDTSRQNISFRAPVSGIVLEKNAVQGMRFMPGEVLYRIADLATVWVIAEVAEQDIGAVTQGSMAQVSVEAFPEKDFAGKIAFIYPTMDTVTRTVRVRLEVANPKGLLKPAMFASVKIQSGREQEVLTVPASAVIDSGTRQVVLVQLGQGNFEPRTVKTGRRGNQYVEILEGIAEGEQVVTSANFLIDSESNLKAALGGMGDANPSQPPLVRGGADTPAAQKSVGHQAQGILEAINDDGTVSITHDPITALKWPAMTMDFALANSSLVGDIQPGSKISFEIVERGEGEWVVTKLQAQHEGH